MASDTHRGPDRETDSLPFVHYNMLIFSIRYLKFPHAFLLGEAFSRSPKCFGPNFLSGICLIATTAPVLAVVAHTGADVIEVPLAFGGPVIACLIRRQTKDDPNNASGSASGYRTDMHTHKCTVCAFVLP